MPMQRERYPVDWEQIAFEVKESVDWRCQNPECNRQCRRPGERFDTHRRTLTVAHTYPDDHAPDAPVVSVAALCAGCHLRLDAERKADQRKLFKSDVAALEALWPEMPALEGEDLFAERYGAPTGVEGLI